MSKINWRRVSPSIRISNPHPTWIWTDNLDSKIPISGPQLRAIVWRRVSPSKQVITSSHNCTSNCRWMNKIIWHFCLVASLAFNHLFLNCTQTCRKFQRKCYPTNAFGRCIGWRRVSPSIWRSISKQLILCIECEFTTPGIFLDPMITNMAVDP